MYWKPTLSHCVTTCLSWLRAPEAGALPTQLVFWFNVQYSKKMRPPESFSCGNRPPPTSNTLQPQAQARAAVVVKPTSGTTATMIMTKNVIKAAAIRPGERRRRRDCVVAMMVDMITPIGLARRDAAG